MGMGMDIGYIYTDRSIDKIQTDILVGGLEH